MDALTLVALVPMHAEPSDHVVPLLGWRYLTAWTWSTGAGVPLIASTVLYLLGVRKLRRNGIHWPRYRTVAYCVLGMGSLAVALMSFLGTYDTVLFWTHMVQHMILSMISPVFITQGAPVTLALRTLPHRPRSWLLAFLHSGLAKVVLFPPLTTFFMVAMPFALYVTPLYDYTLRHSWAHDTLHVWMVVVGVCFFVPILAIDPVPTRMPYPVRLILVFLTMPFHAFIGTTIMGSTQLIAEQWYTSFLRAWPPSPLRDQYWAGALLWSTGDLTMFTTMSAIAVQWFRDSRREERRIDRALDREEVRERAHATGDPGAAVTGAAGARTAAERKEAELRSREDEWAAAWGMRGATMSDDAGVESPANTPNPTRTEDDR